MRLSNWMVTVDLSSLLYSLKLGRSCTLRLATIIYKHLAAITFVLYFETKDRVCHVLVIFLNLDFRADKSLYCIRRYNLRFHLTLLLFTILLLILVLVAQAYLIWQLQTLRLLLF